MNSAAYVANMIANWQREGMSKSEIIVKAAELCMGWPYVWGGYGQPCTSANRKSYAERSSCPSGEAQQIIKKCQILSGTKGSCAGCKYFPGTYVRFFDCRGFTRWLLTQVGISLQGAGATSQWNTESNWVQKGELKDMPNVVCCVFQRNPKDNKTMEHTGMHVGDGIIIHCSGEVKRGKTTDRGWTHYAIPKGIDGNIPIPSPTPAPDPKPPTLRKGSSGEYVTLVQTKLIQLGYAEYLMPYGIDGKFGARTESAVKAFQRDRGLKADGIVGEKTFAALQDGQAVLFTVTVQHVSKTTADEIVKKYGGVMTREGG